jgi:Thioesterase-like superfamily
MTLSFSDTALIKPLSSHIYETPLKDSWSIGAVPNGGYISSLFLLIARQHMSLNHHSLNQPLPINLHLQFLRRTSSSLPATFTVTDQKLGSRITNLHITISQRNGKNGSNRDNVQGYITMSNLSTESGLTLPTSFSLHPPALPANLPHLLTHSTDEEWMLQPTGLSFPKFRKAANNIRVYLPHPDRHSRTRNGYLDEWVRFHPEGRRGRWTNDALGYVVDMFPQIVEEYLDAQEQNKILSEEEEKKDEEVKTGSAPQARPKSARFWYPTLVLNLDVKKALPQPDGVEWLFVRVGAKVIRNGRMDLEILVLDESGEVVAISTHAGLIMGTERNMAGRERKESKI